MILACGSLSCLACWQLLIIRGLARAFLAGGKYEALSPTSSSEVCMLVPGAR